MVGRAAAERSETSPAALTVVIGPSFNTDSHPRQQRWSNIGLTVFTLQEAVKGSELTARKLIKLETPRVFVPVQMPVLQEVEPTVFVRVQRWRKPDACQSGDMSLSP